MCWDVKNLYGWPMSPKLYVDGFKWKQKKFKFTQKFIQNYDDNSNKEYNLQAERTKIYKSPKGGFRLQSNTAKNALG